MVSRLLAGLVALLILSSLFVAALRWWQIKSSASSNEQSIELKITGLSGSADVPRPIDEWPPARSAWLVYQKFRETYPDIRLADRETLHLQGPAQESAVLMAMAGRTAGEIIAANCRVIHNWVEQDFLFPLDEYILALAKQNLSDPAFVARLPSNIAPPSDLSRLVISQLHPQWLGLSPEIWEVICREGRDGQLHVWAWPYQTRTLALYYNRLIFAQRAEILKSRGLDPARAPRTWEETIDYCEALSDVDTGTYGLLLDVWGLDQSQGRGVSHLIDLLWQSGAEITRHSPKDGWTFAWDQGEGAVDTMRFLRELLFRRVRKDGRETPIARYRSGSIWGGIEEFGSLSDAPAMRWAYSSSITAVEAFGNPETLGIAPLPAGPVVLREPAPSAGSQPVTWSDLKQQPEFQGKAIAIEREYSDPARPGWFVLPGHRVGRWDSLINFGDGWRIRVAQLDADMFCITRLAESQQLRDAAWKYIHFLSSAEAQRVRTDLMIETGNAMFVSPGLLQQFGYDDLLDNMPRVWREAIPPIVASGRAAPNGANCQHLHRVLSRMADSALVLTPASEARRLADDAEIQRTWRTGGGSSPQDRDASQIRSWAQESVDYANRRLLNLLPETEVNRAKGLGLIAVTLVAVSFPIALWWFVRSNRRALAGAIIDHPTQPSRVHAQAWTFMAFAVLTVLLWQYFPLARGAAMAFQDYRIMDSGDRRTTWVGLDNFARVFTEPTSRRAAINTLLFVALSLAAGFFTPILLAIVLDELPRGSLFFRMIYYLPAAMGGLVVAYLWAWFFSPQPTGLLNVMASPILRILSNLAESLRGLMSLFVILSLLLPVGIVLMIRRIRIASPLIMLGLVAIIALAVSHVPKVETPIDWLNSNALLAMICVIVPGLWAGVGPGCIIYLAALKSIPDEVYEAADLDGAGPWRKILSVTFPHLWPLVVIQFIGAFIGAFRSWESIFIMTGGGPKDGTLVIGMEIWYNAFAYLRFGYATALAWILGTLLIGFAVFQLRVLRNARFATANRE
jgi:ABC-type sugar transport system permease subunit/ABC-type glycerol-3-phosphate transport system substrate-binding protein